MSFDISVFVQQIANSNGLLSPSHFTVQITTPPSLLSLLGSKGSSPFRSTANILPFFCESAQLPGVELALSQHQRYGYGPNEKKPYGINFSDVNLRFIGDGQGEIWNYFQTWLKLIVNYDARNGINSSNASLGVNTASSGASLLSNVTYPYELAYKTDYFVDLQIIIYDKTGHQTITVILREAFPMFLGDVKLDWMAGKEIMKVPVTFTFVDWYNLMTPGGTVVTHASILDHLSAISTLNIDPHTQIISTPHSVITPGDSGSPGNTD